MVRHSFKSRRALVLTPLLLILFFIIACGAAPAEPVVVEKQVIVEKEVIKEVPVIKEVIKEVPVIKEVIKKVPVIKEVIKEVTVVTEVIKEVVVIATPAPKPVVVVSPKYGGYINMLDYAAASQSLIHRSQILDKNLAPMFNKLVEFNPETADVGDIRCDLCTSWELANDGMTYTFHLVDNAKWWDEVPVTADDVVFMFESIVAPDQFEILKDRPTSGNIQVGLYYESGNARAVDDYTVEVATKFPTGSFISSLAVDGAMVQAKHTVIDQGIVQTASDMGTLNGSGPFKFVKHIKDVSIEYEKTPGYFKEGWPYINGMKHFVIIDSGRTIAAFKSGQVLTSNTALTNMTTREAERLDQDMDNLTVFWGGPTGARHVYMNTTKAPLDNADVRRAVHLALHRQPIIETMSAGRDSIGYLNPPGFWYSRTQEEYDQLPGYRELNGQKHPDDVAEARRLLQEAGHPPNLKVTLSTRNCCAYGDISVMVKQ